MQRFSPDVLLAMGSYASIGPVLAARWLNIPIVLHEANVIPGRAIQFPSRWAEAVAAGFPVHRSLDHAADDDELPGDAAGQPRRAGVLAFEGNRLRWSFLAQLTPP